jgi:hypothetical protein
MLAAGKTETHRGIPFHPPVNKARVVYIYQSGLRMLTKCPGTALTADHFFPGRDARAARPTGAAADDLAFGSGTGVDHPEPVGTAFPAAQTGAAR